ncbi:hypothetical protein [Streptomyces sp. NPDC088254]|uniref:hypothetical protein n=1 Tax=Streptomyces sp. NPDC088254 TaxID=3365847 RepID=UPI003827B4B4
MRVDGTLDPPAQSYDFLLSGKIMGIAEVITGTSGTSSDDNRARGPGLEADHTPSETMANGPDSTHSTAGYSNSTRHSSADPTIIGIAPRRDRPQEPGALRHAPRRMYRREHPDSTGVSRPRAPA